MPVCGNCGSFVSRDYVRVFTPNDCANVRCCPSCPDKLRTNGKVRDARNPRKSPEDRTWGHVDTDSDESATEGSA